MAAAGDGAAGYDAIRVRAEHLGLFETSVLHARLSDAEGLTEALRSRILDRRARDAEGVRRSNIGGWHSRTDMLQWGGPAAETLAELTIKVARRLTHFADRDPGSVAWSTRMWANVSPTGALNMSHAHPGGVAWAAVYYVDMGMADGEAGGGSFYIEDPRFPVPQMTFPGMRVVGLDGAPQETQRRFRTRPGDLILFPAWLRHGVDPHQGSRERISIAMNLYVKDGAA